MTAPLDTNLSDRALQMLDTGMSRRQIAPNSASPPALSEHGTNGAATPKTANTPPPHPPVNPNPQAPKSDKPSNASNGILKAADKRLGAYTRSVDEGKGNLQQQSISFGVMMTKARELAEDIRDLQEREQQLSAERAERVAHIYRTAVESLQLPHDTPRVLPAAIGSTLRHPPDNTATPSSPATPRSPPPHAPRSCRSSNGRYDPASEPK